MIVVLGVAILKNELHMLFLCPFSNVAWFNYPWFIKIECIAHHHRSIPDLIQALITLQHPQITSNTLYTFPWCLWKVWNVTFFCRKVCKPSQVRVWSSKCNCFRNQNGGQGNHQETRRLINTRPATRTAIFFTTQDDNIFAGNTILCDAA